MPRNIILTSYTYTGIENVEDSQRGTEDGREMVKTLGRGLREVFIVMCSYDGILVVDVLDDETASAAARSLGKAGNVTTESMKAFTFDAFRGIIVSVEECL